MKLFLLCILIFFYLAILIWTFWEDRTGTYWSWDSGELTRTTTYADKTTKGFWWAAIWPLRFVYFFINNLLYLIKELGKLVLLGIGIKL